MSTLVPWLVIALAFVLTVAMSLWLPPGGIADFFDDDD